MTPSRQFFAFALVVSVVASCGTPGGGLLGRSRSSGKRDFEERQTGPWTYWYDYEHQHLRARGNYREDRQEGLWTNWREDGTPEWQTTFRDGRLSGLNLAWNANGELSSRGFWLDGVENGPWTWWSEAGQPDQQGEFARGKPIGRWTYWRPDGSMRADGLRLEGARVGTWRFWSTSGQAFEKVWPAPAGWSIVAETRPDGTPKRDGFLRDGQPAGRWSTWHESGARRLSGEFRAGQASGMWYAWRDDGEPLAVGRVERERPVGEWLAWIDGKTVALAAERFAAAAASQPANSAESSGADAPVETLIPLWIAELCAPAKAEAVSRGTAPEPDAALVASTDARRLGRIQAQPWTATEEENLDYLVNRYTHGAKSAKPPVGSRYGRRAALEPKGDVARASRLIGQRLPQTKFTSGGGDDVDLDTYKGKRVVLVVLRGYAGMVCVYCATQTKALATAASAFAERNAEVLCVYPGPEAGLPAFKQAYESLSGGLPPPYAQLADADFKLIEPLGLRGDLAIPATLILDEDGIVRWAYVGTSAEDRPSTDDMLKALADLRKP